MKKDTTTDSSDIYRAIRLMKNYLLISNLEKMGEILETQPSNTESPKIENLNSLQMAKTLNQQSKASHHRKLQEKQLHWLSLPNMQRIPILLKLIKNTIRKL